MAAFLYHQTKQNDALFHERLKFQNNLGGIIVPYAWRLRTVILSALVASASTSNPVASIANQSKGGGEEDITALLSHRGGRLDQITSVEYSWSEAAGAAEDTATSPDFNNYDETSSTTAAGPTLYTTQNDQQV